LYWKFHDEIDWTTAGTMTAGVEEWCGVQQFSRHLTVSSGRTVDLKVKDSAHEDCKASRFGFDIP